MTGAAPRAGLATGLVQCAEACKDAVGRLADAEGLPSAAFRRRVLFAIALLEATAGMQALEAQDIRLVRTAASDAAAVCRTQAPTPEVTAVVSAFAAVERLCDEALGDPVSGDWQRFLFPRTDLEVLRDGNRWRVRGAVQEVEDRLLDVAIALAFPELPNRPVGELTVQILDWYARA